MDKRNDHVSIDCKKLADSFRGKFSNLYPLSKDCFIYEVPPKIRMLNESLHTPKMVSIGPLHYGREELKVMEEHKLRYLQEFLQRTQLCMEDFLEFIKQKEVALRNCYEETIKFESETFVTIIFLDAVFLIEIFLRMIPQFRSVDRVFSNPGKIKDIVPDIMLLENQLPMFILHELFVLAKLELPDRFKEWPLSRFVCDFLTHFICRDVLTDTTSMEKYFFEAKHFVDLLRLCLQPRKHYVNKLETQTNSGNDREIIPSITKLHQSGITFKQASTNNLLDIKFRRGTLEIPRLTINNMTIHLLRNLHMFELLHCDTNFINDYCILLNCLLSSPRDVKLLIEAEVIDNWALDIEGVSELFRELGRNARVNFEDFCYSVIVKYLQHYSRSKRHKLKAKLRQIYFRSPLVSISVNAASIVLILTFIQTVCTIIGLR